MQTPFECSIKMLQGLKVHFKQPDGTSRPGTDWMVAVNDGRRECRILVRVYAGDVAKVGQQRETAMVVEYVAGLLRSGWTLDNYKGEPGELTLPISQAS